MLITIRPSRLARLVLVAVAVALLFVPLAVSAAYAAGPTPTSLVVSPAAIAKVVAIAAAIGVLLPLLQSLLQKPWWSSRTKAILTVVLAVLGGVAGYVVDNGLDFSDPVKLALWFVGAYTAATTLYARLLHPIGVTDYLEHAVNGTPTGEVNPYDEDEISDGPSEDEPTPATIGDGDDGVPVLTAAEPDQTVLQNQDDVADALAQLEVALGRRPAAEPRRALDADGDGKPDYSG